MDAFVQAAYFPAVKMDVFQDTVHCFQVHVVVERHLYP